MGCELSGLGSLSSVCLLGGVGMRGRNLERGGAGGALALGGGQLMGEYNNQPKVGSTPGGVRDAQRERIIAQGRVQGRR